jgi:hypothetical protein
MPLSDDRSKAIGGMSDMMKALQRKREKRAQQERERKKEEKSEREISVSGGMTSITGT